MSTAFPIKIAGFAVIEDDTNYIVVSHVVSSDRYVMQIVFQGILKMLYTVPEKSVSLTDVRKLMAPSLQKKMLEVEVFVMKAEKFCDDHHISESIKLKVLGFMAANLILTVLGKRHKDLTKFDSFDEVGVLFVDQLRELTGHAIPCPWVAKSKDVKDPEPSLPSKPVRGAEKTHESFGHNFV